MSWERLPYILRRNGCTTEGNMYSTIGDMFPKSTVATITGIGGLAAGTSSFLINKGAGMLYTYSENTFAGVLKLVDKPDLGSGAERRRGSIPFARTQKKLSY